MSYQLRDATPRAGAPIELWSFTSFGPTSWHYTTADEEYLIPLGTSAATFGSTIHAVQTQIRATKTGTDAITVRSAITDNGGTNKSFGVTQNPGYPDYETLPPDVFGSKPSGGAWNQTAIDALEIGYERVV